MSLFRISMVITGVVATIVGVGGGFVVIADMDFHVAAHGSVEPVRVLPIRVRGGGLVEDVASSGRVEEDEVLIRLSSGSSREALTLVEEQMALIQAEIEKEEGDLGNPQRRFALANSLKGLQREAARLRRDVRNSVIRAPFAGTIVSTHVERGEYLATGERLVLILADDSRYVFKGDVTPEARAELHVNQQVEIRVHAYPHLRFGGLSGRVESVEGVLKEGVLSSYCLTVSLQEPYPYDLHMGLSGSADIIVFHGTPLEYFSRREDL